MKGVGSLKGPQRTSEQAGPLEGSTCPLGKRHLQVVCNLSRPESWASALPTQWGRGQETSMLPLGGLVGERGPLLGGLQSQGGQPWPRPQHCPWRRKNIPKKKPVTDEPHPALPSPSPHPAAPRTLHTAGRQEASSSETAHGHDTGREGRGWWLWRSLPRAVHRSAGGSQSACRAIRPWPPASPGRVCAWAPCPAV